MISRLRSMGIAAFALGILLTFSALTSSTANAITSSTLLATETFSTGIPATWTDYSGGGWYYSTSGDGGTNGSAVFDFWDCYTGVLRTPTMDASAYSTVGDTAFVDFDMWFEMDYYGQNYPDNFGVYAYGTGSSAKLIALASNTGYTYDNSASYSWYSTPLTSTAYWKHYHLGIPAGQRTAGMQIGFSGDAVSGCGGNAAIDNVTVTGTHYNRISYAPTSINFGIVTVGSTAPAQSIVISNPNPIPISVTGLSLSGAPDFAVIRTPTVIPAGTPARPGKDSVLVTFGPFVGGARSATLSFSNSSDGPSFISVPLTGTGVAPIISVSPLTLFSRTRTKLGATLDQFVIVTAGGAGSLVVSPTTSITGIYASEYSILKLPAGPIPAGQTDTIWVRYSPTQEGSRPAVLNILSNASNGAQTVALKGIGVLGRLVVSPNPLNFDSVAIGQTVCQQITLYNPGTDTVLVSRNYFSSGDADYILTTLAHEDTVIPPEKTKIVTVCFTPLRNGLREARFRVTTNIPLTFGITRLDTSSFIVNILGVGVPSGLLSVKGSALVDSAVIGKQICRTDTFYNKGSADLTVTSVTVTGANAADYQLSGIVLPLTVPAGGNQIFSICATPSQRGDRNAALLITGTTNGSAINSTLPLDVYGQLVCASAAPQTAFANKTCVGMTDTSWVTVSNCGDVSATYTAALAGTSSHYKIVGSATSALIGPGATATFGVIYTPIGRGSENAALNITAANGINQAVTLTGAGQAANIAGADSAKPTRLKETSPTFTVKLSNTGECEWVPGIPTVSDPQFSYVSGGATAIPAGGSGTLTMTFAPTAQGEQHATLSFPSASAPAVPAPAVAVSGYGLSQAGVARVAEADGYSLKQNYPNPFNPTTEIRFVLPKDGMVRLDIIDVTGRAVRTVLNERMSAGEHGTVVNASDLASGVYYYQLTAGSTVLTRSMVLAK